MSRGTIVIVHKDALVFGDISYALRSAGYSVFSGDERDKDISVCLLACSATALIIDKAALNGSDIAATITRLSGLAGLERIVLLGELEPEEAIRLERFRCFTALRPPFDMPTLFAALEDPVAKRTEREHIICRVYDAVDSVMLTLGITRNMTGHAPMREALFCMVTSSEHRPSLTAVVYPHAAARLSVTGTTVERAIRSTVDEVWSYLPDSVKEMFVPGSSGSGLRRPTNKRFLNVLCDHVRRRLADELERLHRL